MTQHRTEWKGAGRSARSRPDMKPSLHDHSVQSHRFGGTGHDGERAAEQHISGVKMFRHGDVWYASSHIISVCEYTLLFSTHLDELWIAFTSFHTHNRFSYELVRLLRFAFSQPNNQPNPFTSKCLAPWLPLPLVNSPSASRSPSLVSPNAKLPLLHNNPSNNSPPQAPPPTPSKSSASPTAPP